MLLRTKSCQKWSPYKVKGAFSMPVCARKQTNCPPGIDQGFSTDNCNACHALSARGVQTPTSPCPTLSASSKQMAPTDNTRPKTDDTKKCHWLLKVNIKLRSCDEKALHVSLDRFHYSSGVTGSLLLQDWCYNSGDDTWQVLRVYRSDHCPPTEHSHGLWQNSGREWVALDWLSSSTILPRSDANLK